MKILFSCSLLFILFAFILVKPSNAEAYEGIKKYYIRYDVKSSNNKISDDTLLMIPAENDFRAENFSQQSVRGVISAGSGKSESVIQTKIKEDALKTILLSSGLKSIAAKDNDTVISYEGAVVTPLNILSQTYRPDKNQYQYTVQVEFSPIAFPDKWEQSGITYKIKEMAYDFFQLFK